MPIAHKHHILRATAFTSVTVIYRFASHLVPACELYEDVDDIDCAACDVTDCRRSPACVLPQGQSLDDIPF